MVKIGPVVLDKVLKELNFTDSGRQMMSIALMTFGSGELKKLTHMYDHSFTLLGTSTSIKGGRAKLVL